MNERHMDFLEKLKINLQESISALYQVQISPQDIILNETKKEFEGDFTFVVFPLVKTLQKSPEEIGTSIGDYLLSHSSDVVRFNVVKGFLNLEMSETYWLEVFAGIRSQDDFGKGKSKGEKVLVEFASPNTNKPLHLGHIRNILLGWSCSKILEMAGYEVHTTQVINDRGIAICKSMLAWQKFGNGQTPQTSGMKGDHFVGDYYVRFEQAFAEEYRHFQQSGQGLEVYKKYADDNQSSDEFFKEFKNRYFNEFSILGKEAKQMLIDWESGVEHVKELWTTMNNWVYAGFKQTFEKLGVTFDSVYYESETYLLGKKVVEEGLKRGVFYQEQDSSVWINLEDAGMDRKIILRSDGTSVYITQDIGTAMQRYQDLHVDRMVYTVADEQDYHFKVLFEILKRLNEPYAGGLYHLSYGMVELPSGRMKSREGTVVDADDLLDEVIAEARINAEQRGEIAVLPVGEQEEIFRKIGTGAIKYFMIKVQPKRRMIFDPSESVDMQGTTGPYIQNAFVRIQSLFRKSSSMVLEQNQYTGLQESEKSLIKLMMQFPDLIQEAARSYEPSVIANYAYALAKEYHRFYHEVRILGAASDDARNFRLALSHSVAGIIEKSMSLLGIEMPDRM